MPEQIHTINKEEETSFIGLRSYTEAQAGIFFGRDEEIEQLTKLVETHTLTIVFGKSGTGKTSLLNAGVFPRLRKDYCLPFRIRLEFQEGSPDLISQVKKVLKTEIDKYGFKVESYPGKETLWEYFHKEPLWKSVTPILIFDQFEEIFTLAQKSSRFGTTEFALFWEELSDLIENCIPEKLKDDFLNHKEKIVYNHKNQPVKVLFSFREEYLPEFETLTAKIPSIKLSRFRLMPMNGKQAYEVITKTWGNNINPGQADRIVTFFSNDPGKNKNDLTDIEPSLLSQVCLYIEKERLREGGRNISSELLDKYPKEFILRSIYNEAMAESNAALPIDPNLRKNDSPAVPMNEFVEEKLITDEGYRFKHALTEKDRRLMAGIAVLNSKYFIRNDGKSVELTHDVLAPLIKSDREKRRKMIAAAVANKKARRKALLLILFTLLAAIGTYLFVTYAAKEKKKEILASIKILQDDSSHLKQANDSLQKLNTTITRPDTSKGLFFPEKDSVIRTIIDSVQHLNDSIIKKLASQPRSEPAIFTIDNSGNVHALTSQLKMSDSLNSSLRGLIQSLQRQLDDYRSQLAVSQQNFERLQKEFYDYKLKYPVQFIPTPSKPIVPDENSLILNLNFGSSKNTIINGIYLIPTRGNNKLIRDLSVYEISCDNIKLRKAVNKNQALYYNGKYFFPNVKPDNYFIKICSYYGNYKYIGKGNWKKEIPMDVNPPVQ